MLLEDYPEVFEVKVTSKMLSDGTVQVMRGKSSLDSIGSSHCLYPLITQCLMDEPEKRPNTRAVNSTIADIKEANSSVSMIRLDILPLYFVINFVTFYGIDVTVYMACASCLIIRFGKYGCYGSFV